MFEQYKHTAAAPRFNQDNYNTSRSQDTVASNYNHDHRNYPPSDTHSITNSTTTTNSMTDSSSHISNQENNNQYMNTAFPPLHQSNIYQSSFHSSMIDPIGSIIGLRCIYMNGQLAYVPVEPHINLMINKQFGNQVQTNMTQTILPQIQPNMPILAQNAVQPSQNAVPLANPPPRSQSRNDVYQNRQDPYSQANLSRQSANQQYRQNTINAKYGSLPNLSQKPNQDNYQMSSQERHKLELQQQIEDNKRRKALEKQKELEYERKHEREFLEYQKKVQEEDRREKMQMQEKARAMELRNQQVYERQQRQFQNPKKERRPSVPQQQQQQHYNQQYNYNDYPDNEEPIRPAQNMRSSNSFSEYSEQRPSSRSNRNQQRYEQQQHEVKREQRIDSSRPREVEWWQKAESYQDRVCELTIVIDQSYFLSILKAAARQSAVIPTLRGKPPPVPDSQRSGYDSSGNVGEHQSRPSSRTTPSSQRSSDAHSEEPIARNPSGGRKAPTAFTIDA
ncbi:hypothetical protein CAEBREN_10760 [Caenorhabditis brenneri]|uniref:Uncharacterized protein n=1 Tax=Caenorhabditis brenneri TaxID=135651 RepID=G0MHR9_CAEBE|nr:hypothetical protein CAEBREN_10760 [Caenorhabditis brenneri]